MYKKLFKFLSLVVVVLTFIEICRIYMIDNTILLIGYKPPTELHLRVQGNKVITDKATINELHEIISNRLALRASVQEERNFKSNRLLSFEYGYKGNDIVIDTEGRVLISVYKSEIRKRTPFHRLWAMLDDFFGDNQSGFSYITKADPLIKEKADKLLLNK
jgi:hypothetical protein